MFTSCTCAVTGDEHAEQFIARSTMGPDNNTGRKGQRAHRSGRGYWCGCGCSANGVGICHEEKKKV